MTNRPRGLSGALDLASRELPPGTAPSRLTHYCGRLWDLLRSADWIETDPATLPSAGASEGEILSSLVSSFETLVMLVNEGIDNGQFARVSPRGTARLILASLFARAQWCNSHGVHPLLCGSCPHTVVETLEFIWPALAASKENS